MANKNSNTTNEKQENKVGFDTYAAPILIPYQRNLIAPKTSGLKLLKNYEIGTIREINEVSNLYQEGIKHKKFKDVVFLIAIIIRIERGKEIDFTPDGSLAIADEPGDEKLFDSWIQQLSVVTSFLSLSHDGFIQLTGDIYFTKDAEFKIEMKDKSFALMENLFGTNGGKKGH